MMFSSLNDHVEAILHTAAVIWGIVAASENRLLLCACMNRNHLWPWSCSRAPNYIICSSDIVLTISYLSKQYNIAMTVDLILGSEIYIIHYFIFHSFLFFLLHLALIYSLNWWIHLSVCRLSVFSSIWLLNILTGPFKLLWHAPSFQSHFLLMMCRLEQIAEWLVRHTKNSSVLKQRGLDPCNGTQFS